MAKTDLDDYLSYGVDSARRRIYFGDCIVSGDEDNGAFSQRSVELAIRALHRLEAEGPGKPIELHLNSYGGDVYASLRLSDQILNSSCQVKFFGGGAIMSAAVGIMSVCDERYLYPNATIMLHEITADVGGRHTDVQIDAAEGKRLQAVLCELYANNSRMPKEFWAEICQRDLYLTADETVKLGLADKILDPKKRGNLRKMRQASLKKVASNVDMDGLVKSLYARVNRHNVPKLELNKPQKEPEDPNIKIDEVSSTTPVTVVSVVPASQ